VSFKKLNLHPNILKALEDAGYTDPTEIQQSAIPTILEGRDLRASAQTGTGKTAAFILPALQRLTETPARWVGPRVLILVPTRELAMQITEKAESYSKHMSKAKVVCIYGGAPYPVQNRQLSRPYEILVATPGRLIDHMERGRIDFSKIEMLILDEADRMLDMGFVAPVEQIAAATPANRQTLLFSATMKGTVLKLSERLLNNPVSLTIHAEHAKHDNIEQRILYVDNVKHKMRLLDHLLKTEKMDQAIVFSATKRHADEIVELLREDGHRAEALHGDMNQRQRTRTMERMRDGNFSVLVATDVAARGIDVQTISHVINFDLPQVPEDYVHRIGRTGRAGAKGVALSFVSSRDAHLLREIERYTGQKTTPQVIAGLEPTTSVSRAPAYRPSAPRSRFGRSSGGGYSSNSRSGGSRDSYSSNSSRDGSRAPYSRDGGAPFSSNAPSRPGSGRSNSFKRPANGNSFSRGKTSRSAGPSDRRAHG